MDRRRGLIHVIAGCMYSGKTEILLRHLRRHEVARRSVLLVKPSMDTRTPPEFVKSRSEAIFPSRLIDRERAADLRDLVDHLDPDVVGIEEAEFITDPALINLVETLAWEGRLVHITGLDTDFLGRPFGPMPTLLAIADEITKLTAICVVCGETATRTQRLEPDGSPSGPSSPLELIGGMDGDTAAAVAQHVYQARCRLHHRIGA
jgi:thymidine kinase